MHKLNTMKNFPKTHKLVLLILVLILNSCSTTNSLSDSAVAERDGSSKEKAIIVNSINAEYQWVTQNYPGSKVTGQALIGSGRKHYDILTFVTQDGETKKAYFDISSFFGKF